jgi:GNAT superfamily N-acetyltransferase
MVGAMRWVVFGLTVSSSWGNGHATLWRGLIRALHRRGHHVTFFERDVPYYRAHRDLTELPEGGQLVLYSGELPASRVDLHRRRWGGHGVLGEPAATALREAAHAVGPRWRAWGLRLGGEVVSVVVGFAEARRTCLYLSGFAPELADREVGTLVVGRAIEGAIAEGHVELDFLRGGEVNKKLWGATPRARVRRVLEPGWPRTDRSPGGEPRGHRPATLPAMRLELGRSALYGTRLRSEGLDVTVVWPERSALLAIDARWPPARPPGAPHAEWRWEPELRTTDERFALQGAEGALQAVWAVTKRPPRLDGATWYRPNVLEVVPEGQRARLGTAAMSVIAKRARELGHEGVVVEAVPAAVGFYRTLGARAPSDGEFRSWRVNGTLVRLVFDRSAVDELIEVYDELCAAATTPHVQ